MSSLLSVLVALGENKAPFRGLVQELVGVEGWGRGRRFDGIVQLPRVRDWIRQNYGIQLAKESCLLVRRLYDPTPHAKVHCTSKDQKSRGEAV